MSAYIKIRQMSGVSTAWTDAQRDSRRLALLVSQQTAGSTGAVERMVRGDADFHVTGSTQMPACLIETGFLTNREERTKLAAAEYQEKMRRGGVSGEDCDRDCAGHRVLFSSQNDVLDL